ADGRVKNAKNTLDADESYRTAGAHLPSSYAASFYLQPKTIPSDLPLSAPPSNRRVRRMNGSFWNRCAVFLARSTSRGEKYTIYFFSEYRNWNRMRRLADHHLRLARKRRFSICRCCSMSGKRLMH